MPTVVMALTAAVPLVTGALQNRAQSKAASKAAGANIKSNQMAIDEQKKQFAEVQKLLQPYTSAGEGALQKMNDLNGVNGEDARAAAIKAFETDPLYTGLIKQGEDAIMANASATGGLRGGNVQGALAAFRPELLNSVISQNYNRLAGVASLGQNAAAGVGNVGMNAANQVGGYYNNQGYANANAALASGQSEINNWGNVNAAIGQITQAYENRALNKPKPEIF